MRARCGHPAMRLPTARADEADLAAQEVGCASAIDEVDVTLDQAAVNEAAHRAVGRGRAQVQRVLQPVQLHLLEVHAVGSFGAKGHRLLVALTRLARHVGDGEVAQLETVVAHPHHVHAAARGGILANALAIEGSHLRVHARRLVDAREAAAVVGRADAGVEVFLDRHFVRQPAEAPQRDRHRPGRHEDQLAVASGGDADVDARRALRAGADVGVRAVHRGLHGGEDRAAIGQRRVDPVLEGGQPLARDHRVGQGIPAVVLQVASPPCGTEHALAAVGASLRSVELRALGADARRDARAVVARRGAAERGERERHTGGAEGDSGACQRSAKKRPGSPDLSQLHSTCFSSGVNEGCGCVTCRSPL